MIILVLYGLNCVCANHWFEEFNQILRVDFAPAVALSSAVLFWLLPSIALNYTANFPTHAHREWKSKNCHPLYCAICSGALTIISIQLSRIGIENTVDIKNPLLSKYCCFENDCQLRAAISLMSSEKYTITTI